MSANRCIVSMGLESLDRFIPIRAAFLTNAVVQYTPSEIFLSYSQKLNLSVPDFCRASTLSNAVSSLANTGMSFTKVDEREKQAALEEEQARLKALKVHNRTHFRNNFTHRGKGFAVFFLRGCSVNYRLLFSSYMCNSRNFVFV